VNDRRSNEDGFLALYHYEASKRQHEAEQAIKTEAA